MRDTTTAKIGETAALVLRAMLESPKAPRYSNDIAREIGAPLPTVREVLKRLETLGWLISSLEETDSGSPGKPRRWFNLTPYGLRSARAELKMWTFTDE